MSEAQKQPFADVLSRRNFLGSIMDVIFLAWFYKIVVRESLVKFTGKYLRRGFGFNKFAGWTASTILDRNSNAGAFLSPRTYIFECTWDPRQEAITKLLKNNWMCIYIQYNQKLKHSK